MSDLISRQAAITIPIPPKWNRKYLTTNLDDAYELGWDDCQKCVEALPAAQPEIEERMSETEQNVPNDDFISRKGAIDAIEAVFPVDPMKSEYAQGIACGAALSKTYIEQLPSAQPDIIRCEDCKWCGRADKRRFYRGMDCLQKRIDTIVPDKDFCSKAERRTDERTVSE